MGSESSGESTNIANGCSITRSNWASPLYQLPNEVIEEILLLDQAVNSVDDPQRFEDPAWIRIGVDWPRLMLVCSLFREVAVTSTRLWSAIRTDQTRREWIDLCIERAGQHPLELYGIVAHDGVDLNDQGNLATACTWELISRPDIKLRHFRVRHGFNFYAPNDEAPGMDYDISSRDPLINALSREHPCLSCLELIFATHDATMNLLTQPCDLEFLGGHSASLTYLFVDNFIIHPMPYMPHLKQLILRRFWIDIDCCYLRMTLSQTPALSRLRFDNALSTITNDESLIDRESRLRAQYNTGLGVELSQLFVVELVGSDIRAISRALALLPNNMNLLKITVQYSGCVPPDYMPTIDMDSDYLEAACEIFIRADQYMSAPSETIEALAEHTIVLRPTGDAPEDGQMLFTLQAIIPSEVDTRHRLLNLSLVTSPALEPQVSMLTKHASYLGFNASWLPILQQVVSTWVWASHVIVINLDLYPKPNIVDVADSQKELNEAQMCFEAFTNITSAWLSSPGWLPLHSLRILYDSSQATHAITIPDITLRQRTTAEWEASQLTQMVHWVDMIGGIVTDL